MEKPLLYLRLIRPANVVTAVADVLAGIAISGYFLTDTPSLGHLGSMFLLCIATIGLYSGGVVFNDIFDADEDKHKHPERLIANGRISRKEAFIIGNSCFMVGILASALAGFTALAIATLILVAALIYDKWSKHMVIMGPVNMGLCRGLNLLLGVSIFSSSPQVWWLVIAVVPIVYIASITMINSRKGREGNKKILYFAAFLYALVIACILFIAQSRGHLYLTLLFVMPFYWMIFDPLFRAMENPVERNISKSVQAGIIALILLNAAWASAFGIWYIALIIILLLPLSLWLNKNFSPR